MDVSKIALEIAEMYPVYEGKHEDEVTIQEMATAWGLSYQAATNKLEHLVSAGRMTKRKAMIDGKQCNVYRRVT